MRITCSAKHCELVTRFEEEYCLKQDFGDSNYDICLNDTFVYVLLIQGGPCSNYICTHLPQPTPLSVELMGGKFVKTVGLSDSTLTSPSVFLGIVGGVALIMFGVLLKRKTHGAIVPGDVFIEDLGLDAMERVEEEEGVEDADGFVIAVTRYIKSYECVRIFIYF